MKFALHQFNPIVGAIEHNVSRLIDAIYVSLGKGCDIFISTELSICGYIPKDVLLRPSFHQLIKDQLQRFLSLSGITLLVGAPHLEGKSCYNSVLIIRDGQIIGRYDKHILPNYAVFDEFRYFTSGEYATVFEQDGLKLGIIVCEDMWQESPGVMARNAGAEILISLNASPFNIGKNEERLRIAKRVVAENNIPLIYVNQLGGQDDLVFDGASFVLDSTGELIAQCPAFESELNFFELGYSPALGLITPLLSHQAPPANMLPYPDTLEAVYKALSLAVYDYVHKNGFQGILLGLSGGIDSALTLAIAVDALGADKVMAVMMPSVYTADISIVDAREMVERLQVKYEEIEINPVVNQLRHQLAPVFEKVAKSGVGAAPIVDVTDENLQARSRGILLMAISNKLGYLVLTTGNKSEMATGYATLYGDMAGGFALLKDVPKTLVYELSKWRNKQCEVIPQRIITRPPSAELRENQTDQDSLPDYAVLDAIIELLVEKNLSSQEVIARGFAADVVNKVARLIKLNEYKRYQSAIGPRITSCAFNNDWRYPITNHFQL